ncbi:MAG: fibrobacter succinogenes major paralogous domain-containing protein [Bacteroidetes bacterium]|nr:fibrobacter succinogenes major paralogous domain-containing protein [Bacteroidota bacterium]
MLALFTSCNSDSSGSDQNPFQNCGNVADIDDNIYSTVTIGTQCWTTKNLNVSRYRNGDIIPQVTDATEWANLTTGAWCYYNNDSANGPVYGKLYNWYAVNDPRGLAPLGYHIPSNDEWTTLIDFLGGENVAGKKMKSTTLWNNIHGIIGDNSSGFSGIPAGIVWLDGVFKFKNLYAQWWTADEGVFISEDGIYLEFHAMLVLTAFGTNAASRSHADKHLGQSVRCIKD